MPTSACPVCAAPVARCLDAPSKSAQVNYYRCEKCQHVWAESKTDPSEITHVTPPPQRKPA
jgi:rubredoxin